ncbi:MAG: MBL fold metallo-hydrolase RNA specificity domain-containing protein [Planctomycetota bacterium]|jgi:metallo-beta-lactamase family protein
MRKKNWKLRLSKIFKSGMDIKLRFLGAAQNVTGSRHLLEANGVRVLVDCGLYQERHFRGRNWEPFLVPPASINAVLLTHAHLDHCGLLPKLVKEGFRGRIYCTAATADIAQIILLDSAKIQEEDAEFKRRRHKKEKRKGAFPEIPLYTTEDAEACLPLFSHVEYRKSVDLGNDVETTFYDAGHVLGSSIIRVKVRGAGEERIILFSGDIGRPDRPIICDPTALDAADYVLIESTYGDRVHSAVEDAKMQIADAINHAVKTRGNVVVPSFALERSQELLYYMNELLLEGSIPHLKVYLDSPMASRITKVFQNHPEMFDDDMSEHLKRHESPFKFPGLEMAGNSGQSKAINDAKPTVMIIAGSGMCTGGRIKHHLVNNIENPKNTIMFVGYQANGTPGRSLVDGAKRVRILGEKRDIKAKIVRISGFSAHADRNELLAWLKELESPPRKVFVVHGEAGSAKSFSDYVRKLTGWDITAPAYGEEAVLG